MDVITNLQKQNIHLDFILCEIFLHIGKEGLLNLPGYTFVSKSRVKMTRGGVAIYIRDGIEFKSRSDLDVFIEGQFESLFIEAKISNMKYIVGGIYRVPSSDANLSDEHYDAILSNLKDVDNVIIGTDQNFDLLKIETHRQASELLDALLSNTFVPTITKPTRITHSSATLIDNIYIKYNKNTTINSAILVSDISDHFPVFCTVTNLKAKSNERKALEFYNRKFTDYALNKIQEAITTTDWDHCNYLSIDNACKQFIEKLNNIIDCYAPLKKVIIPHKSIIRNPWVTKGLLKSSHTCAKLHQRSVRKSKTDTTYKKYIKYRNIYNRLKRKAKQNYYADLFDEYKYDMKKTWKIINSTIGKRNNKTDHTKEFKHNNIVINNPNEIANTFCEYFTEIGPKFANDIPPPRNNSNYYLRIKKHRNPKSLFLTPTDPTEVLSILKELKSKNSAGHDTISTKFIKDIGPSICAPLSIIINRSLETGVMPDTLKIAKVIPIYKAKSHDEFSNYRPISLLPSISKIVEKIIHKRLSLFLEQNNILYSNQYGFRAKRSTIDAITKLTTDVAISLEEKESVLAVFLDLSKAFDTIDHAILLNKLEFYGIRGQALEWFHSYLYDRKQFVHYNGEDSDMKTIRCGVPQGSVLGPLLFIIYTNDLPDILQMSTSILFADDTTIYQSSTNIPDLYSNMNIELNNLTDWFGANKLSLNISKTNYMLFSNVLANNSNNMELKLGNTIISKCNNVKFLGVYIDSKLKWDEHINRTKLKISKSFFALNKTKHILPRKNLISLYYTLVYPHLMYGITLWGAAYDIYINKLCVAQKKIIRIIAGAQYNAHTDPLFKKFNILKLSDIYKLQISKYVLAFLQNKLPQALQNIFVISSTVHGHNTRHCTSLKLNPYKFKTRLTNHSILKMGPDIWNKITPQMYSLDAHQTLVSRQCFSSRFRRAAVQGYDDR